MKTSTKAALLSGLVFPGLGHIYLKQYVHGIILSFAAASAIYFIVSIALETASNIAAKIQSGEVPFDVNVITDLVSQQSKGSELSINIATIALLACWIVGIVDAYRKGRTKDLSLQEQSYH